MMKLNLCFFVFVFGFFIFTSCEIKNNPTEILSMGISDSVAISGDTLKLYCQAKDGDGDDISYSWASSGGTFMVNKDTALWIAPNRSGFYNITCKVSDGVGSSDAKSITVRIAGKVIKGQVLNALDGTTLANADVNIGDSYAITDSEGNYTVYLIYEAGEQFSSFASKDLFCPFEGSFKIPDNYSSNRYTYNLSISPVPQDGEIRLVLNWGEKPSDLDSHIKTPEIEGQSYHILYSNKGSSDQIPFVKLDIDDTSGFGPETFTISQTFEGIYSYYIYQYSSDETLSNSNATVNIYNSPECEGETIIVPDTGEGRYWYVCDINGLDGAIIVKNIIQAMEPE